MRIAFLGTVGPMTLLPLGALARDHEIVAVVRPWPRRSALRRAAGAVARRVGLREPQPLEEWARTRRIPCITMSSGKDETAIARLAGLAPDLVCISTFRWVLGPRALAVARLGVINLHPSLLPRHRGPVPLYWIYHRDDRETGVTVHRATARADAGPILGQVRFPLPRGISVDRLDAVNAERGAELLARVAADLAAGRAVETPQDESLATPAPFVRLDAPHVDFQSWPVERVWHFLAGLFPRVREPLRADDGRRILYDAVLGYEERRGPYRPGRVSREGARLRLHCLGGDVILAAGGETAPGNGGGRRGG